MQTQQRGGSRRLRVWLWFGVGAAALAGRDDVGEHRAVCFADLDPHRRAILLGELVEDAGEVLTLPRRSERLWQMGRPLDCDRHRSVLGDRYDDMQQGNRHDSVIGMLPAFTSAPTPPGLLGSFRMVSHTCEVRRRHRSFPIPSVRCPASG